MSEEQIQKFIQSIKKVSLSMEEKSALKNQILLKMDQPIPSPYQDSFSIIQRTRIIFGFFRPAYGVALLLVFILGGGVSFAAEGALPGNFLYPIKVEINEKVAGIFTIGNLKKAERESELIDKRLQEVKILASQGELSDEKIKIVEDQISTHAKNSKNHIVALEDEKNFEGALQVQAKLESSLTVNEKIITQAGKNKNINVIVLQVKEELSKVSNKKASIEQIIEKEPGFGIANVSELKLKNARLALLEAIDFVKKESVNFENSQEKVSSDAQTMSFKAESEIPVLSPDEKILKLIEVKIATGEIYLRDGEHEKAIKLFEEAYLLAREILLFPEEIKQQEQPKINLQIEEPKKEIEPISVNSGDLLLEGENLKESKKVEKKPEVKKRVESKIDLMDSGVADVSASFQKEI